MSKEERKKRGCMAGLDSAFIAMEEWENGHPIRGAGNYHSIKELGRALEFDPSRVDVYIERAERYTEKKKFQRAIRTTLGR
jgi:hypothetical protein